MKFKKIVIENFRPYKGYHKLKFSTSASKNITVISAENNCGKTSLFEAIKWCLYDELPPSNRGSIINKECLRRLNSNQISSFDVRVTIDFEHDKKHYRAQRTTRIQSVNQEKAPESYLYLSGVKHDGSSIKLINADDETDFSRIIDQILPKNVYQYFIVDGDKIKQFTDPTSSRTKEAIEHLLKLNRLHRASQHLLELKKKLIKELAQKKKGKEGDAGDNIRNRWDQVTINLKLKKEELGKYEKNLERLKKMIRDTEHDLADATESSELQRENEHLDQLVKSANNNKDTYLLDLSKLMSFSYFAFLEPTLREIYDHLEKNRKKGKIPKPYDEVFLKDLLKQCDEKGKGECICGTKFEKNDRHYNKLLRELKETPPKSISDMIQPLQKDLNAGIKSKSAIFKQMNEILNRIDDIDEDIEKKKKRIADNKELIDEKGAKNEPELRNLRDRLRDDQKELKLIMEILEQEVTGLEKETEELERKIRAVEKIDIRTQKLQRKIKIAEDTLEAVEEVHEKYRKKLRKELVEEIDGIFLRLFTARERFRGFVIDNDYNYDIISREGESWKFLLSNAQRKLLAFSFVAGLRRVAEEEAPFVLDSPLGIVDRTHRKNYANTVPSLASQLILLLTSSEETSEISDRISNKIGSHWKINYDPVGNISSFEKLV